MFRYGNTFKAIRWGVFVGGLFGMHRYYRSRDVQAAATWFFTVSGISFANIWISYGLQEFVTQHGSTKGLQGASREEYHRNAYKHYIERAQENITNIDYDAQPVMRNSQTESMEIFISDLESKMKNHYQSQNLNKDEVVDAFVSNQMGTLLRQRKLTSHQLRLLRSDEQYQQIFRETNKQSPTFEEDNKRFLDNVNDVLENSIDKIDLKSYDFNKDPDCMYKFNYQTQV